MLIARVALGSVFLCVALQCVSSADRRCLRELPLRIREIQRSAPAQRSDGTLYTPTIENYTNCPVATLRCFADELKVLIEDWEISNIRLKLSQSLYKTSSKFNQPDADCLHCELLQEENPENFLDRLLKVVEMMNTQFCKRTK